MKFIAIIFICCAKLSFAQPSSCENIFIITTDGFRWQELFNGADSSILFNQKFVRDTAITASLYWADNAAARRKKLMPFTWEFIVRKGQIHGNRAFDNQVAVANPYHYSYAGYNELVTGYADRSIITNKPKLNPNANLLAYVNDQPGFRDKVAVFSSWNLFPYILNQSKTGLPVNSSYTSAQDRDQTASESIANYLQHHVHDTTAATRSDLLTFSLASEYIKRVHPRVMYIGFGETDEFAHHKQYDQYLSQANMFDKFLAELWAITQRDDFYRNKTTFFITTDHGRGRKASNWNQHGPFIPGSDETWMMQLGPNITSLGELTKPSALYTEQFAQTIAAYLGLVFKADHPIAESALSLLE